MESTTPRAAEPVLINGVSFIVFALIKYGTLLPIPTKPYPGLEGEVPVALHCEVAKTRFLENPLTPTAGNNPPVLAENANALDSV